MTLPQTMPDTLPPDERQVEPPPRVAVTETELACMMCNRPAGVLVHSCGELTLKRPNEPAVVISTIDGLRCTVCGGNVISGATETRMVRIEEPMGKEEPRRGRPPRWLVDQRRAAAALAAMGRVPREGHW